MSPIVRRCSWLITLLLVSLVSVVQHQPQPAAAARQQCFPETGQCLEGRFLEYWEQNGGLLVFGYPITPARMEQNRDTGQSYITQWFERNRFEHHSGNAAPYDVLLGRLGDDALRRAGIDWQGQPRANGPQEGCLWFEQTRHNVCDQMSGIGFKTYWSSHGLEFDGKPGKSYEESLALFGLPLTEPRMETNSSGDTVLTQWFERARFEWHPQNPNLYKVLLGLLGNEVSSPIIQHRNAGLRGELLVATESLFAVAADGSRVNKLHDLLDHEVRLVVSPDGKKAATRCTANGATGICTMKLDGTELKRLNQARYVEVQSWSPNGQRIAYVNSGNGERGLYVINADGSNQVRLMGGSEGLMVKGGGWSPDSSQLVFETTYGEQAVYVVNADGTNLRRIAGRGWDAHWSPDGKWIAFISDTTGNPELYLMNPDGTGVRQLTSGPLEEQAPAWSPDSARVAVLALKGESSASPASSGIYVVQLDNGQTVRALHTETSTSRINSFRWSPYGDYVAAHVSCPRLGCAEHIRAAKIDGSQVITLVEAATKQQFLRLVSWLKTP